MFEIRRLLDEWPAENLMAQPFLFLLWKCFEVVLDFLQSEAQWKGTRYDKSMVLI